MRMLGAGIVVLFVLACVAGAEEEVFPTPEIAAFEELEVGGTRSYVMRAEWRASGHFVGMALVCAASDGTGTKVVTSFGSFPDSPRRVQLGVRGPDGKVSRFGRAFVSPGPTGGFHSPELLDRKDIERFARAAVQSGALVSNGYRSFWNRVSAVENDRVLTAFLSCVGE